MRPINELIVHCSATQPDWMAGHSLAAKVQEIRRWHKARGWSDIGYHHIIDRDGKIAEGRSIDRIGAHVRGKNTGTIGVCLLGGHGSSENDNFSDNFTPEQDKALRGYINDMDARYGPLKISPHHAYAAKACPGFRVQQWLNKKPARTLTQSTTLRSAGVTGLGAATAGGTAISQLDGTAQIITVCGALLIVAGLAWIMRERIKYWAKGVR